MNQIAQYQNGNTTVTIFEDGTKIREFNESPKAEHPESIDVKISDYCDMGCKYCHESSTTNGKHADLNVLLETLSVLPAGVELAIGGGNPLAHPQLLWFLSELKVKGLIANITVNQGHLKPYQELLSLLIIEDLVKGVGISITNNNFKYIHPLLELSDNIVYHMIAGVNETSQIDKLIQLNQEHSKEAKILVLGYKVFGFGVEFFNQEINANVKHWRKQLPNYIGKCTLSFDNLAIEQLKVKRLFTVEGWNKFYMGDDFTFTMYIDAVKQEFAPTSRSPKEQRVSFERTSLLQFFQPKIKSIWTTNY